METIIQHFSEELSKSAIKILSKGGLSDIDQFSLDLLSACKESICALISELLHHLNTELRKDKMFRKNEGLVLKEKDRERSIELSTGTLHFKRDYYVHKESGKYTYPLDDMVGITSYSRISDHVSALLVNQASESSYEKSAAIVTGGNISKQTVKNKLKIVGKLEKKAPEEKLIANELQVLADEDHANLQNGKNHMVPLITICEGVEVQNGRNALINPVHFKGDIKDIERTWENVAGYIHRAYDEDKLKCINLHGDGASWIKKGEDALPNCRYIMDGFHFEKHLKSVTSLFPGKNYRHRIRETIFSKALDKALEIVSDMQSVAIDNKQKKKVKRFKTYLKNNWNGIVLRYTEDVMGSCTEGLVSHVYSERLSRNPMGWSEEGLNRMAELRVYTKNGCEVVREDFRHSDENKERSVLAEYARELWEEALKKPIDWSIFENGHYIPATNSPTQILIRSYGKMRSIA